MKTKHISDSSFRLTAGLALKNLTRQKRRNAVLAIAIAFGFFVVTTVDGLVTGMVKNLENQITQMMGGTVLIQGIEIVRSDDENKKPSVAAVVRDSDYIRNLVEKNVKDYDSFSYYSIIPGQMIFEGKKSLSTMYGRNLTEQSFIESLQFVSGGTENFGMNNPLIISDKTADSMNLAVGDSVTFSCETIYGQNNVDDFTVAGIIKSNSFLSSMQTYTDISVLNKLIEIPEASYSTFTINLKNKNRQAKVAGMIEELIRKDGVNVTSRLEAVKTNPANVGKGIEKQIDPKKFDWEGTKYAVETLYDEVPAIKTVLSIVHTITTVILLVILFIVMVGVSNTYRMVLYERIREIGTMRSLGMDRKRTRKVFTAEAVILCLIGAVAGLVLSVIAMAVIHLIPVNIESLSFFLNNGHFTFTLSAGTVVTQYILLVLFTIIAVSGSARKAAKLNPAEALRSIK
ncbi:MAG: ABC transporter permease [Spirochaetaceae bacterium]|nr:ABC transporter permease [Spirochaetaceae bacterium]